MRISVEIKTYSQFRQTYQFNDHSDDTLYGANPSDPLKLIYKKIENLRHSSSNSRLSNVCVET